MTTIEDVDRSAPINDVPKWIQDRLGFVAHLLFPKEVDPDAELLINHVESLEKQVDELSERLGTRALASREKGASSYHPFPLDTFPDPLTDFVSAASTAIPCAPAMVALPALSVLSSTIGCAARLRLKRSWEEIPVLWTAVVAPSGSTKSAAAGFALRPVYRREGEAARQYDAELDEYKRALDSGESVPEPTRKRYRMGDVTREAAAKVLSENQRGVLLARDELATWLGSFDRYANGSADLHAWLAFYEGRQETVDRVSRDNVTLSSPAVPVTGTIQPETLKSKLTELHFETGFAPRISLCMPPVKTREWTEADVTVSVEEGYDRLLDRLYGVPIKTVVELSPGAKRAWIVWYNAANRDVHSHPEGPARAVTAKAIGHAARLTLLLHLAEQAGASASGGWWETDVRAATVRRATRLAKWLRNETLRVYDELSLVSGAIPPIKRFLNELPEEFRTSEAASIAHAEGIPERTMYDWLKKLQDVRDIEKVKRGLYQKV